MRKSCRNFIVVTAAAVFAAVCGASALHAEDDDEDEDDNAAVAKEALDKSVARGKELFRSKDLGKKTCASCHEDPEKPNLNLTTRDFSYPKYSNKKKTVVTMGQKINEMLSGKTRGKEMDLAAADLVALESYVASLRKKK